jgi:hypothetical protein
VTPRDEINSEARALLDGYLDDRLDEAGVARLKELIIADPQVRRAYVQMMTMLGGVHRFLQERPALPADIFQPAKAAPVDFAPVDLSESALPLLLNDLPHTDPASGGGWLSFFGPVQGLLFAAVVACGIGAWMWVNRAGEPANPDIQEVQLAHLPFDVRLDSGTARLSLPNVGYVIVEGPAEFTVLEPKRARLNKGKIKMRVTQLSGRGFVVETPDGDVTDLGTEFGLDVADGRETGLVVFEGAVDLRVAEVRATDPARVERFVGGEGAVFNKEGRLDRIVSVVTGNQPTFHLPTDADDTYGGRIIASVADNFRRADTKKFYEIVPGGLGEDVLAYADRTHQWNGITAEGIPAYLVGADYIKTFNGDLATANRKIYVNLARPAKLYVFFDVRGDVPTWLRQGFRDTGDRIGLDAAPNNIPKYKNRDLQTGAGNSVDEQFAVWERLIESPGTVVLDSNPIAPDDMSRAMYGIAAVPLEVEERPKTQQ